MLHAHLIKSYYYHLYLTFHIHYNSVVDLDPHGSALILVGFIRIQEQEDKIVPTKI
jgi:hypothetical protein